MKFIIIIIIIIRFELELYTQVSSNILCSSGGSGSDDVVVVSLGESKVNGVVGTSVISLLLGRGVIFVVVVGGVIAVKWGRGNWISSCYSSCD